MNDTCKRCGGACCEFRKLATSRIGFKLKGDPSRERDNKQTCPELQNGLCKIYDGRPQACIDFKVGSEKCLLVMEIKNPELHKEYVLTKEK